MGIEKSFFGKGKNGEDIILYTITNKNGLKAAVTDLGAVWLSMVVPASNGEMKDVLLGVDSAELVYEGQACMGEIVGRNANRIKDGLFTLNGKTYKLAENNGRNNLHSGPDTLNRRVFDSEIIKADGMDKVLFKLYSPENDQGYPGELFIEVMYSLSDDNNLAIEYRLTAGKEDTIANFTSHPYFNLAGHDSGYALKQLVSINADYITENDEGSVPTGRLLPVENTAFDFRTEKPIERDIEADDIQLKYGNGYDHNFCINRSEGNIPCATAYDPESGRYMEIFTDCEGLQFYTGNGLSPEIRAKKGASYQRRGGYAFETQFYPNAINIPSFKQPVVKAGETMNSKTVYRFTVR